MPGQRKRARSRERQRARTAVPGRWEPLFSTEDAVELKAYVRRLRSEGTDADQLRLDTFCGRLEFPTTYRVSVFVPEASE
ncbi:hypothetical protein ABZY44_05970 [Streptomyces sp. NPDC006544]|uniref:hypothetical protein n=1 Tax=Streptomyces sp. NPDC006544 TaxID=3154583 RepID=UPI0033BA76F1